MHFPPWSLQLHLKSSFLFPLVGQHESMTPPTHTPFFFLRHAHSSELCTKLNRGGLQIQFRGSLDSIPVGQADRTLSVQRFFKNCLEMS